MEILLLASLGVLLGVLVSYLFNRSSEKKKHTARVQMQSIQDTSLASTLQQNLTSLRKQNRETPIVKSDDDLFLVPAILTMDNIGLPPVNELSTPNFQGDDGEFGGAGASSSFDDSSSSSDSSDSSSSDSGFDSGGSDSGSSGSDF